MYVLQVRLARQLQKAGQWSRGCSKEPATLTWTRKFRPAECFADEGSDIVTRFAGAGSLRLWFATTMALFIAAAMLIFSGVVEGPASAVATAPTKSLMCQCPGGASGGSSAGFKRGHGLT